MAVSFLTETNRFATVFLKGDIFCLCSDRSPWSADCTGSFMIDFSCSFGDDSTFCNWAFMASSLVILPPTPVPWTAAAEIPFSANILVAAGGA